MNIRNIIYSTADERLNRKKILTVSTLLKQLRKPEKKFRLERDSTPRPLRCRCSTLPTELSSQLGAGHIVSS